MENKEENFGMPNLKFKPIQRKEETSSTPETPKQTPTTPVSKPKQETASPSAAKPPISKPTTNTPLKANVAKDISSHDKPEETKRKKKKQNLEEFLDTKTCFV